MFTKQLYPDEVTASVYGLNWERLSVQYRGVIFDIDNTLVPHGAPADEKAIRLFQRLHDLGMKTLLVSNNKEARVSSFAAPLKTDYVYKAGKPKKAGYERAVEKLGLKPEHILFIGDQVFTDIWGANRAGMHTLLTEPVDPSTDEIQIVVKRWFEKPFRKAFAIR
ncbi:MAG: YqeG family HAD IIIA-type phosphatase [Lachnospiraceae bacterium]|nr:YqeG family HAD IIIA-type phosphatase [Lachnospiraceae bacterium]